MVSKFGDTVSFKRNSGNKTVFLTVYEIVYRNAPVYTLVYGKLKSCVLLAVLIFIHVFLYL